MAACRHVDRSIDDPAEFINTEVIGTCILLEVALDRWRRRGTDDFRFLHVSTADVFGARHVILRTAWLYSPYGTTFVRTILRLAQDPLTVVGDQIGCPTAAREVAKACLDIALRCAVAADNVPCGLYHFAGAGTASWIDFTAIVEQAAGHRCRRPQLLPIATAQHLRPGLRPADSQRDCTAVRVAFGVTPWPWRSALAETVDCLLAQETAA